MFARIGMAAAAVSALGCIVGLDLLITTRPVEDHAIPSRLRGAEVEQPKRQRRVIVVGGSAAFGLDVAEPQTFAARLDRLLDDYEVSNAGVIGHLSGQELALVVTKLIENRLDAYRRVRTEPTYALLESFRRRRMRSTRSSRLHAEAMRRSA